MKVVGKKHYKQYTLKDVLGTGSFGKVYYSPPYAVKQMNFQGMSPFVVNALKNQITILNQINHQNVVKLVDYFYEGTCVYLVMEYCEQDLAKYLKKNKCDEKTAIYILKQLVLGFRELVNQGIIHRDLKPANILVNSKGEFKLADFGFAKFVDHYDSKLLYSIVGTPLYMSPQILNKTQYTTKSDIWSLGFIFYEMLTGTYPWMGVSQSDLYKNITTRPLNVPQSVSAYSKDLIIRMLKPNEKERISWQELFAMVLSNGNSSPEKQRPQTSRDAGFDKVDNKQNGNGRSPSRKKLFPVAKEQPKIVEARQNIVAMQKQNKENSVSLSEQVIKQIFQAEIQRFYGDEYAKQIVGKQNTQLNGQDKQKLDRVFENFNQEFQRAVKTILKGGLK